MISHIADHADDLALLTNTSAQAKSLLPSLEQTARGSGFNVNKIKQSNYVVKKKKPS